MPPSRSCCTRFVLYTSRPDSSRIRCVLLDASSHEGDAIITFFRLDAGTRTDSRGVTPSSSPILLIIPYAIMQRLKRTPLSAILMLALAVVVATGCQSLSNTEKGAIIGTGTGGAAGAAVGKAVGGTAEGAIIGAVVGGAAGAIIGQRMDRKAEELENELANADVERIGEGIVVTFDSGLLFDFDSAALRSGARSDLREFANSMQDYPETEILVVGHTDSKGSAEYNMGLSERRADSAADFLIDQGISANRLRTEGRGETEPVATNDTEAGRQQNRRVEVAIFASEEYREDAKRQAAN